MGCRRASSTVPLVMVIVAIFLLALDHSVAHARPVRSPSMSTGEHPSTKEVLQATRKPGSTVGMMPGSTGEAGVVGRSRVEQPSFGGGGNSPASAEKMVVVARYDGPRPHPKQHN